MPAEALITVRNLSVKPEKNLILQDVSLEIFAGERVAIIGPNGAGKTSLLRALLGLVPLHGGEIFLHDAPIHKISARERARWIGYVPQTSASDFSCTVEEFVFMGRYPYLSLLTPPSRQDHEAVEKALTLTGMATFAKRSLETLSGGERQKVMIAGALTQEANILLLDEPATFLDPRGEVEIETLLDTINREFNTTIVLVSHNLNTALSGSHRVFALKAGQLIFSGPSQQLLESKALDMIFDIPFQVIPATKERRALVIPQKAASHAQT